MATLAGKKTDLPFSKMIIALIFANWNEKTQIFFVFCIFCK